MIKIKNVVDKIVVVKLNSLLLFSLLFLAGCSSLIRKYDINECNTRVIAHMWSYVDRTLALMQRPNRLFKINPEKTVLLIVDMQNAFCSTDGCIEIPDSRKIIKNINKIIKLCREKKIPIIWLRMNINPDSDIGLWPLFQPKSPVDTNREKPPEALSKMGPATEIYKELDLDKEKDIQIFKSRYSAFIPGSSDLLSVLNKMNRDILIITGVGTNVCCESTARDAMMLNFKVIFISDANATVNRLFHEISLMNIKMFFGDVITTEELIHELKK